MDQYVRLTDDQWDKISIFLQVKRKRKHDLRDIIDAILWITGLGHKGEIWIASSLSGRGTKC